MKEKISVACCQLALRVGEAEHNRALSAQAIRRAAQHGANVIVLPELVNSGYVLRDKAEALALAEAEDGPSLSLWGGLLGGGVAFVLGSLLSRPAAQLQPQTER